MFKVKKMFFLLFLVLSLFLVSCSFNKSVKFTLYFDSNGGSEVASIETSANFIVEIPKNPTKEGFIFSGWYWDNHTFTNSFTVNSLLEAPISSNVTVYAKWTINDQYTTISMEELQGKLDAKEDFVFYIGYEACSACLAYNVVVKKYIKSSGSKFYYLDVGSKDGVYIDYTLEQRNIDEILEALGEISHRDELENLEGLSTPTTIVVRNGIFVDAKIGAIGLQDASDYLDYVEFIEGNQVR